MDMATSLGLMMPEIVLGGAGLVLLLLAAWGGDRLYRAISFAAIAVLILCATLVLPALCSGLAGEESTAFLGQLRADAFASFAKLLVYLSAAATLLVAPSFFERLKAARAEFPVLILFSVLGMGIMVSATDLMALYIGLELSSLSSYVLAALLRDDERSAEAGLKYFVLGALASGMLLFGMSLVYGFTGTTSFTALAAIAAEPLSNGALFGMIFMLVGLAFKISAVPFHMWTPDVYEGASTPVTTFFASAPKVAAVALTMRVTLDAFGAQVDAWQQIIIFAALASIIVGALGAIGQTNIKRLLAYSSINNIGFILIGLAAATPRGASAMLVYLVIYVAMTVGAFVAVLMLKDGEGRQIEAIADMAGLSRHRKVLAGCFAVLLFSLAGIPPLLGFWGKFVVFEAAVDAGLISLAVIGIAASVISAFYYIMVVKVMYFDEPAVKATGVSDWAHQGVLALFTLFVSPVGFLLTKWMGEFADKAAAALFVAI